MNNELLKMLMENNQLNVYGDGIEVKTYLSDESEEGIILFSLYTINGYDEIDETIDYKNCINSIIEFFEDNEKDIISFDCEDVEISYEV